MKTMVPLVALLLFVSGCREKEAVGVKASPPGDQEAGGPVEPVEPEPGKDPAPEVVNFAPEEGMGQWVSVDFGGEGEVAWQDGVLHLGEGAELTGARWDGPLPKVPYEVRLEARKTLGDDFFCGLTVPVQGEETCVTFIVGGWGGGVVGISSIDGFDASENETTDYRAFHQDQWYAIRLQVTEKRIDAWIDDAEVVEVDTEGKKLGLRSGPIDLCAPFGIAAWQTRAEIRNFTWRPLP